MADDNALFEEIRDRFRAANDSTREQFEKAVDDLKFIRGDGYQWPTTLRQDREQDQRPCLEINKLPTFADQIIGDLRQNEPQIKIKPVDSKADPKTAEILTGLIRNIEVQNDAETAYDTAAESAIICGVGAWRVGTDYGGEDQFEQDITIRRIKNPFTVYWDPASQNWTREDSVYCFVTEKLSKAEFRKQYPKAGMMPFDADRDKTFLWGDDKSIRVAEYFKKEDVKKKIFLMQPTNKQTGQQGEIFITSEKPDPEKLAYDPNFAWEILRERSVETYKLVWYKVTQSEVLEGPIDWPGKYIPVVMVYGKELNIEGETDYRGVVRNAKDPQRLYNYSRSTGAEVISLAPKAPYLVTANQIKNYQRIWEVAHKRSFAYLPFDVDPSAPGMVPQRAQPVSANTGIRDEIMMADQELRDTTGLQQASLGMKSNEKSGRAIIARQREGDVGAFPYHDNLARALRYQGKILVDLIPKIYDTPRIVRILNRDGTDKFVPVNQPFEEQGPQGAIERIYDLTVGKYDVVVSIGPAYSTEREEAATNLLDFVQAIPAAGPLIADRIAKNLDFPGSDELEKRLKLLLPPSLQQAESGQPPPAPPPPNPAEILQIKRLEAEAKSAEIDAQIKFVQLRRLQAGLPMEPRDFPPQDVTKPLSKEDENAPKEREE